MSRASRARRVATAAAYGGGGIGAVGMVGGAAVYGLLVGQTRLARRRIPQATSPGPASHVETWCADGVHRARAAVRVAMLGDSTAAGYGVADAAQTPGALVALGVSAVARRPVRLTTVAVVGAESNALSAQLARLPGRLDLAVVMIGANDVTHRIKPAEAVRHLGATVGELRRLGAEVVVGTCPDLGTIRPIAQPLRTVARRISRNLAAAQTIAVVEAGGRTVSLGDLLGPLFAEQREMFGEDQFHPSAAGYAAAAEALLPSCLDVLGLHTAARAAGPLATRRARPVAKAAAKAAGRPGTEVAGAEVHGRAGGRRGRWAKLRRRRQPAVVLPSPSDATVTEAAAAPHRRSTPEPAPAEVAPSGA